MTDAPPPEKPHRLSTLDYMVFRMTGEADRVATFARTREGAGIDVPIERWSEYHRTEYKLFNDLAQLAHLVRLVEADFKKLVNSKLGVRPRRATNDGKAISLAGK